MIGLVDHGTSLHHPSLLDGFLYHLLDDFLHIIVSTGKQYHCVMQRGHTRLLTQFGSAPPFGQAEAIFRALIVLCCWLPFTAVRRTSSRRGRMRFWPVWQFWSQTWLSDTPSTSRRRHITRRVDFVVSVLVDTQKTGKPPPRIS
jgi:hypothetical protein